MKQLHLFLAFFAVATIRSHAQPPTVQDCLGAIPVCQEVYSSTTSLPGTGNYPNEINPNISCTSGETFSVWYTFTVNESGDFGFVLTPNNLDDDYDWALFNITDAECEDIYTDPSLAVSCNAAGGGGCHGETGVTGESDYDVQGAGCNFFPPTTDFGFSPVNALVPVEAGNTYVLMVSNWTNSSFGYELDFGLTDVGVFDLTPPQAVASDIEECSDNTLNLSFTENVDCSTISSGNFNLVGPDGENYDVAVTSDVCDAGGEYDHDFTLIITPALTEVGQYTLGIGPDDDGVMITDVCGNVMNPSSGAFFFDAEGLPEVDLGEDQSICDGQALLLEVPDGQGVYEWQDGTNSTSYEVTASGTYSLTITNNCGEASDEISINLLDGPPVIELGNDTTLCEGETLNLQVDEQESTYLWQDGSTNSTFQIENAGNYTVTVTNACGEDTDTLAVDYVPGIDLGLPLQQEACEGDTLLLDVTQPQADYLWEDGSTDPLRVITAPGSYMVTASNECTEVTANTTIEFLLPPSIALGEDTTLCSGQTLSLDATFPGGQYLWEDSTTLPVRTLDSPGPYAVTVTNVCGQANDRFQLSYIPAIDSLELGEDQYLCNGPVLFDVTAHEFASYRWQDGNPSARYETEDPGLYTVEVYSECETLVDSVYLFECEYCKVYVPNAFSPNDDGRNDRFYPQSACELMDYQLEVFNRWGARVFAAADPSDGWDGTFKGENLTSGLYVWVLKYQVMANGIIEERQATGDLSLLR